MANQLKEELILNTGQFDSKIDSVIRKVEELKQKGNKIGGGFDSSMGKMIQRATGFNGSMGSLVTTVTKLGGALGLITSGVQLADWFRNSVREGLKLAEQGEGIRIAFERLNNPNLLANLREQTHNTVTDLELMKQAVKFEDFNLPIDQMGTLLAFAQQKAKDTGESIDYMVDSIVTGLGRKSLPILDNLGLSANEIKERMKDGADMTTAVANIIKEKMEAAGGYVETAADRAKQKEVELQIELENLGRTFQPLTEASGNFWHSIEVGAIKAINKLAPLINQLTELGRISNQYEKLGGDEKVNRLISNLGDGQSQGKKNMYQNQLNVFKRYINERKQYLKDYQDWAKHQNISALDRMTEFEKKHNISRVGGFSTVKEQVKAAEKQLGEYQRRAKQVLKTKINTNTTSSATTSSPTTTKKSNVPIYRAEATTIAQITENVRYLEQAQKDAEPNSQAYKDITKELENWRRKLLLVDFDDTATSVSSIQRNINILRSNLGNLDPNSKEFEDTTKELIKWENELGRIDRIVDNLRFDDNANTINQINDNISILHNRLGNVVKDSKEWLELQEKIKYWEGKKGEFENTTEVGSTKYYREQLAMVEKQMEENALTNEQLAQLAKEKRDLEDIIALREKAGNLSDFTKSILTGNGRTYVEQFQNLKSAAQQIQDWWEDNLLTKEQADEAVKRIQQAINEGKFPPIEIELVPKWKKNYQNFQATAQSIYGGFEGINNVVSSIESFTEALKNGANEWDKFMGVLNIGMSVINAIGSAIESVTTITKLFGTTSVATSEAVTAAKQSETAAAMENASAKATESVASATASGAKLPFPYNLAAIAAGIAAVVSALALMGTYANGGVIGGNSYSGDRLLARVNSGEAILNQNQQKHLFTLLDGNHSADGVNGNVKFIIQGKDLVGTLSNYNKINSKLK